MLPNSAFTKVNAMMNALLVTTQATLSVNLVLQSVKFASVEMPLKIATCVNQISSNLG